MKILITLIVTQSISTIIGFVEFKEPQEVIALALELFGIAILLLLRRMNYSDLIQRLLLLCLATIIFLLMPNSQFKYFTGTYHIVIRIQLQKKLSRGLLLEWLVLLLVILIFGTSPQIHEIFRSVFAGIAIMLMEFFLYQDQLLNEANKPQIMMQSKINYTIVNNDGSNPRNIGDRIVDPKVTSLFLDDQYNVQEFSKQSVIYQLIEGDVQDLLQGLHINKIDSKSKQLLPSKCNQISLKYFLDQVKNNAIPMVIQIIDYTHPKIDNHIIKIIYQNDFEIQFYDIEERDKYQKRSYIYAILKQLFNTMSHEFGTSLNYLLALSQVAIDKYNDQELQSYFQPIKATGMIMYHFVLDMIDFNAFLGKKLELQFEKLDIIEVLDEVKSIFSHSLQQKGLTMSYDVFLYEKTIFTDRRRLKQILITLISNAQKFTFKGGIKLLVKSTEQNKYIQFEIIDTGVGLTTTELETLTDILKTDYKNEQKISKNTAGFGLGSYLCNKIAMSLANLKYEEGGGIKYSNNQEEKGTKVTFKIINEQLNINYTLVASQDNSSGILKIGKNVIVDLKQSQIELSLSGLKKPLTKRFSTVMVPKVKSFHEDQNRDHQYFKQPTKDCFQGMQMQYTKIDSDSVNEETNEEDYQKRLQIQNVKFNYGPSDIIRELRQQSVGVSEPYVLDCKCKTILIVDDEMINILGLELMLKSLNLEADHAFNGLEAIKKLEQAHCLYSIIFMDINMPIMDGYVTTKAILNKYKAGSPKIIACTAFTDSQTRQGCYEVGMSHFINKPVNKIDLQKLLCYLIN
ncbi:unnamed protein product [Paramecium primaurelia]|uniref:Uncharacterized protein n=1 Tax=Paramecium primaurelia TaxID=5886 RepID=A0A8S1PP90_PARPR|nr:unnamed protein product [Paramecium primaurelia]